MKTICLMLMAGIGDRVLLLFGYPTARETIDGALVGGASLKADVFSEIISKTAEARA